jgi:hypothetical protein
MTFSLSFAKYIRRVALLIIFATTAHYAVAPPREEIRFFDLRGGSVSPPCGAEARNFEFFTNGPAYRGLDPAAPDMLTQRIVDQRLVIPPSRAIHYRPKMLDYVIVEPNRDAGLPRFGR